PRMGAARAICPGTRLTHSNRRRPPYHGGLGAVLACTAEHARSRFPANRGFGLCRRCPRVPARAQPVVPVSYPPLVARFTTESRESGFSLTRHDLKRAARAPVS